MANNISIDTELLASIGTQIANLEQELKNVGQRMSGAAAEVSRVAEDQEALIRKVEQYGKKLTDLSERTGRLSRVVKDAAQKWEETERKVAGQPLLVTLDTGHDIFSYRVVEGDFNVYRDESGCLIIQSNCGGDNYIIDEENGVWIIEHSDGSKTKYVIGNEYIDYLQYSGYRYCKVYEYDENGKLDESQTKEYLMKESKYYGTYLMNITWSEDGSISIGKPYHDPTFFMSHFTYKEFYTREYWSSEDRLLEAEHSKQVIEDQKKLVSSGGKFSEEEWNKCSTPEEQDAFLERLYKEFCRINGTKSSDIDFKVLHGDGPIEDQSTHTEKVIEKTGFLNSQTIIKEVPYDTSLKTGETQGFFNDTKRAVRVRVGTKPNYSTIVGTMAHECRHQVQYEYEKGGELAKEYAVSDPIEQKKLEDYMDQMKQEFTDDGYVNPNNEDAGGSKTMTEKFMEEMQENGIDQVNSNINNLMLSDQYMIQQSEVDARMVEYEIRDAVINFRNTDKGTQS